VATTALANGVAEEVFFRGALYAAIGVDRPVITSTAVYVLATAATRNPALLFASLIMGALFGMQRRITGDIQASVLTHVTWSALMLRFLPPLFAERPDMHGSRPRGRLMLPGPPTPEKRAVRGSNATGGSSRRLLPGGSSPAANQRDAEQQGAGQRGLDGARPAAGPQDAERVGLGLPGAEQQAAEGGVDPPRRR
jgi:hypothetical protein